ncbi:MAG: hypothetical protein V7749_01100 [Cocleimonas sp.]
MINNSKPKRFFTLKKVILSGLFIVFLYALVGIFYSWVVGGGSVGSLLQTVKTAKHISSFIQLFILGLIWWNWEKIIVLPSNPKAHKALRNARNNICFLGLGLLVILSVV